MVTILPRTAWTTTPDNRNTPLQVSRVNAITVHYPVGQNTLGWSQEKVASGLRAIRKGHLARGWRDIGYNYGADQAGRFWHLTGDDVGAHANVVGNTTSIGVVFLVGTNEEPSPELIAAFLQFRATRRIKFIHMSRVQGHQQVPGNSTACPGVPIMRLVRAGELTKAPGTTGPVSSDRMDPAAYFIGAAGRHVTWYGQRLVAHGFGGHYNAGPGPNYTEADRLNTVDFQTAQGWTGADADGFPGPETLRRLAAEPAPIPVPEPAPSHPVAKWGDPSTWEIGSTGPDVTALGSRLRVHAAATGRPDPYKVGPGPTFTETDREGVAAFQSAQGWSGADADGYPGPETFRRLKAELVVEVLVETISANIAGYDSKHGKANRVQRARTTIPNYLAPKRPMWFHFQECAIDMFPELDRRLPEYRRVPEGGKGRQSYYRKDAGITIIEARLMNVTHMLARDTKEMLVTCWEVNGHRAVDVNFHSENQGTVVQPLQLRDALNAGRDMARKHGIPSANILVTGDANFKGAAAFINLQGGWREVSKVARKKIDLQYHSTNRWLMALVLGRRIDVDAVGNGADVLEAEQLFGALLSDHWPHRVIRRLFLTQPN